MSTKIKIIDDQLNIDGIQHPIKYDAQPFIPNEEHEILGFQITDEYGNEHDGCLFRIKVHSSTRCMTIVSDKYYCIRMGQANLGYALCLDPTGIEVLCYEIGPQLGVGRNPSISLMLGWTSCFIAGDEETQVVDVSTPPFDPSYEIPLEIDANYNDLGKPVNPEYWRYYHTLRSGNQEQIAQLDIIRRNP
jgi:hypothetical protein